MIARYTSHRLAVYVRVPARAQSPLNTASTVTSLPVGHDADRKHVSTSGPLGDEDVAGLGRGSPGVRPRRSSKTCHRSSRWRAPRVFMCMLLDAEDLTDHLGKSRSTFSSAKIEVWRSPLPQRPFRLKADPFILNASVGTSRAWTPAASKNTSKTGNTSHRRSDRRGPALASVV